MTQNDEAEKWRILLADDDPEFRKSMINLLLSQENFVFDIHETKGLQGVLEKLETKKYHALLLDFSFSKTSGIQALKKIREKHEFIPVIIFSDSEDMGLLKESMGCSIKGFLPKNPPPESRVLMPLLSIAIEEGKTARKNQLKEKRYQNIIENLDDAYYETDITGKYTYFNKTASKHFGRPRKELIGLSGNELSPKEHQKKVRKEFIKIYQTGKSGKIVDTELIRPDGSIVFTELSVFLIRDENDEITGFGGISRDVTEKKKAQHALKESEEKHRTILESMVDAYFETDFKGHLVFFNDSLCSMLGYDRDELMGMRHTKYMDDQTVKKVTKAYIEIYNSGNSQIIQYEVVKKDGAVRNHEATVSLLKDKDGEPIGFHGVSRDLTEKLKVQEELRKSEERYRNILDSIEDGYFEVDLSGKLLFFNEASEKILGYEKEKLLTMTHKDYMDKKNSDKVLNAYNKIFDTGKPYRSLQYEIFEQTGKHKFIETSISLIQDENNTPSGFRGVARDISKRKKFEIELKNAKDLAEEASRAKSEFVANMSHEVRTPMNGILGMYNLLLSTDLSAEQEDFVETGKRSADALLSVINDILDFSKIEAGRLDIEDIDFDFRKLMEEIVSLPAIQAHGKGLEFAYAIGNKVPTLIIGDPGRLRQVIMNLCTNAIKFTSEGEVVFRVEVEKETDSDVQLRFSVKDTGIGISKKDQAMLFNSFQQVDTSTTRKYGGTGLGLAISKKLVEMMGGQIQVDSVPGKGSTFWFIMSFDKQDGAFERQFQNAESIQDKRILIVDDNQTNLDILASYLGYWKCACDQALSGEMALSLMRAVAKAGAPYDLVITDLVMPEMDGAELGRIIKADPGLEKTKLIMLTSQGLRGDAAEMKRIGFAAYLNKPVRRSLLYDCLISLINERVGKQTKKRARNLVTTYTVSEEKRRNLKILLAEDNPVNQKLALHLLRKFGFQVDTANDGRLAVAALEKKKYHLVLMDIQMPEMDGLEATRQIRDPKSNVKNHDVFIIAMTAHAMKGDRNMCLKAGMNDYISKPIKPEALLKVIEKNIKDFE